MQRLILFAAFLLAAAPAIAGERQIVGQTDGTDIVTVRLGDAQTSKQGLAIFPGISGKTANAKGLSMLRVVIPPGGQAKAHIHKGYETAVYIVQGRVETRYGKGLKKSVIPDELNSDSFLLGFPNRREYDSLTAIF